jgi:N4-(beta-N-acetylglucosaminyl)-L-asparaginase
LHYLDPQKRAEAGNRVMMEMVAEGLIDPQHIYGTINCDGINAKGEICGVTTTSGLAWKIPGRVGDSPILGAGLYVDGEVGAAGSTGRGEANLYNLCSFLIVENMRRGLHPKDAGLDACRRIKANTIEKRLLNSKGNPNFNINFYALNAKGEYAGVSMYPVNVKEEYSSVSMYPVASYAVCTEEGPKTLPCEPLLEGKPEG